MQDTMEILNVSARFLNTFGYVGVSLLLFAFAYFFYNKNHKPGFYITGTVALCFLVIFGCLDIISRSFPTIILSRPPLLIGRVASVEQAYKIAMQANDVL